MEKAEDSRSRQAAEKAKVQVARVAEKLSKAAAGQLSGPEQAAPEHIGRMLVIANETEPIRRHTGKSALEAAARADSRREQAAERRGEAASGQRIDTISRAELLVMSEHILIDGSSLRQIYESHLVGEQGLRRLIAAHLEGGDLRKALRREVVEREIDFERDPGVRGAVPRSVPKNVSGARGKEALNELLEKAALNINDSEEEAAFFKARALYEASQLQQHKQSRRMVDIGLAGAITILIALVIVLFMTRT